MEKIVVIPPNHYSSTIHGDVEIICSEFFSRSPISVFLHARMFDNGYCTALTNVPNWNEHHANNYYSIPEISSHLLSKQFYLVVDENNPFNEVVYYLRNLFNIYDPFYVFRRDYGYFDMFCFALRSKITGVVNYYINNLDGLNKFIDYFLVKSNDLYALHMRNKIFVPEFMRPSFGGLESPEIISDREKIQFFEKISKHEFTAHGKKYKVRFTNRENEVLYYFSKGMTAKETANELNISAKTVEWHISKSKEKMGLYRRSSIISMLNDL